MIDTTNRNMALASAFVEELARCGVRHALVSPGSRSTPLAVALYRRPEIEVSVVIDERSAGFIALGAAQATGTPVVLVCTSGTAAANYHPAVAEADLSAVPLILLTADRPPELRDIGAGQTIDQIKLYGDAVRWFCEVGNHEADDEGLIHLRSLACRAYATAAGDPRPGPVHLNFPLREPLAPAAMPGQVTASRPLALAGRDGGRPLTVVTPASSAPLEPAAAAAADRIASAPRGLILAGRQTDPALREPLVALAAASGYPVLAEPTSQLRLGPHDRGAVIWAYDRILGGEPDPALQPELVLRFGEMPTSKRLRLWLASLDEADQIAVPGNYPWNEPTRLAGALMRGRPASVAEALLTALGDRSLDDEHRLGFRGRWLAAQDRAATAIEAGLTGGKLGAPALHTALADCLRDGDLVYTNSSMAIRDQEAYLRPAEPDVAFLANRGANGIDGLIGSGIGAAIASGRPTIILTGDVAFLHDLGSLASWRLAQAPVRILVINDGGGSIFDRLPQHGVMPESEFESLMRTPPDIEPERAASLFGLPYHRLTGLDQLPDLLAGPSCLIEARVEPDVINP